MEIKVDLFLMTKVPNLRYGDIAVFTRTLKTNISAKINKF